MKSDFLLGGIEFRTKAHVIGWCREIIRKYPDGVEIQPPAHSVLFDLLVCHPFAAVKIGSGAKSFFVKRAPNYPTRCFYVRRRDGTSTDFSFNECLSPSDHRKRVLAALRAVVVDQVLAFRDRHLVGNFRCPESGELLTLDNVHVDHTPPRTFLALAGAWMTARGLDWDDIELPPPADNSGIDELIDAELAARWSDYHKLNARLRLLSIKGNLSLTRRLYRVPGDRREAVTE